MSAETPAKTQDSAGPNPVDILSPAAPAPLDHRSFPHIVDLIWDLMPHASLVVCAKTCRSWKKTAESRLFNHIAFFQPDKNTAEFRSRGLNSTDNSVVLYQNTGSYGYGRVRCIAPISRIIRRATVLDVYPSGGNGPITSSSANWPELFTRILHPRYTQAPSRWPTTNVHDYIDHNRDLDWVSFVNYHDGHFFAFAGDASMFKASTLTLTVDCRSNPLTPPGPVYLDRLTTLKIRLPFTYSAQEITLILRDTRRDRSDISTPLEMCSCCPETNDPLRLLSVPTLSRCGPLYVPLLLAAYPSGVKSVTIVGAEQFVSAPDQPTTLQVLRDGFAEARDVFGLHHQSKDVLRLRSHNEYRAEVGEARYRMLTVR